MSDNKNESGEKKGIPTKQPARPPIRPPRPSRPHSGRGQPDSQPTKITRPRPPGGASRPSRGRPRPPRGRQGSRPARPVEKPTRPSRPSRPSRPAGRKPKPTAPSKVEKEEESVKQKPKEKTSTVEKPKPEEAKVEKVPVKIPEVKRDVEIPKKPEEEKKNPKSIIKEEPVKKESKEQKEEVKEEEEEEVEGEEEGFIASPPTAPPLAESIPSYFSPLPLSQIQNVDNKRYEQISARVNVLFATSTFESLCDGNKNFLTMLVLNKTPKSTGSRTVWQMHVSPASLTASRVFVDLQSIFKLDADLDKKNSLGLTIGSSEDEIILEFMFIEQRDYFLHVFEMFVQEEMNAFLELKDDVDMFLEGETTESISPQNSNMIPFVKYGGADFDNLFKSILIPQSSNAMTNLYQMMKEKKILKKFRGHMSKLKKQKNGLKEFVGFIESWTPSVSLKKLAFLKDILTNDGIRGRIIRCFKMFLEEGEMTNFSLYKALKKRFPLLEETSPSELYAFESELCRNRLYDWNSSYCRDVILSQLVFGEDLEKSIEKMVDEVFKEEEIKGGEFQEILDGFNQRKNLKMEEISFDVHLRLQDKDLFQKNRKFVTESRKLSSEVRECEISIRTIEVELQRLEKEKVVCMGSLQDLFGDDNTSKREQMFKKDSELDEQIKLSNSELKGKLETLKMLKDKFENLEEEVKDIRLLLRDTQDLFMTSSRRILWIGKFIRDKLQPKSLEMERDYNLVHVYSLHQDVALTPKKGAKGGPMLVLSYIIIEGQRFQYFPEDGFVRISLETDPRNAEELKYEEVICMDTYSPLILTPTLKLYELISEFANQIVDINLHSYIGKKKPPSFAKSTYFKLDTSVDFTLKILERLRAASAFDECLQFLNTMNRRVGKFPIDVKQLREIKLEKTFFNKFLIVLSDIFNDSDAKSKQQQHRTMVFPNHNSLDEIVTQFISFDDQFSVNHPGMHQLLKGFDSAFWLIRQRQPDQGGAGYDALSQCPFLIKKEEGDEDEMEVDLQNPPENMKVASKDLEEKHSVEVNRALCELYDTEKSYVENLEKFCDVMLSPLEGQFNEEVKPDPELLEELAKMRSILEIDSLFLEALSHLIQAGGEDNTIRLMEIIEKILYHSVALKGYASYMCAYPTIFDLYTSQEKTNGKFFDFIDKMEDELRANKSRVCTAKSFLIQPVQRIPRIRMLIERVIKRVGPDYLEHRMLSKAYEKIEFMANYSNSKLKEMKNIQNLRKLEVELDLELVYPGVKLMKNELVMVRKLGKKKGGQKVKVMILSHCILILFKKKGKSQMMKLSKSVVMKEDYGDTEFGLTIHASSDSSGGYVLIFDNIKERDTWGEIIASVKGKMKRRQTLTMRRR